MHVVRKHRTTIQILKILIILFQKFRHFLVSLMTLVTESEMIKVSWLGENLELTHFSGFDNSDLLWLSDSKFIPSHSHDRFLHFRLEASVSNFNGALDSTLVFFNGLASLIKKVFEHLVLAFQSMHLILGLLAVLGLLRTIPHDFGALNSFDDPRFRYIWLPGYQSRLEEFLIIHRLPLHASRLALQQDLALFLVHLELLVDLGFAHVVLVHIFGNIWKNGGPRFTFVQFCGPILQNLERVWTLRLVSKTGLRFLVKREHVVRVVGHDNRLFKGRRISIDMALIHLTFVFSNHGNVNLAWARLLILVKLHVAESTGGQLLNDRLEVGEFLFQVELEPHDFGRFRRLFDFDEGRLQIVTCISRVLQVLVSFGD